MPRGRPTKAVEAHKEDLIALYCIGVTGEQLKLWLDEEYGLSVSTRTIKRYLRVWGVSKRLREPEVEEEIKLRIEFYFLEIGLEDQEILDALKEEGFKIGKWALIRLRLELGLRRRVKGDETKRVVRELLEQQLKSGVVPSPPESGAVPSPPKSPP